MIFMNGCLTESICLRCSGYFMHFLIVSGAINVSFSFLLNFDSSVMSCGSRMI